MSSPTVFDSFGFCFEDFRLGSAISLDESMSAFLLLILLISNLEEGL